MSKMLKRKCDEITVEQRNA